MLYTARWGTGWPWRRLETTSEEQARVSALSFGNRLLPVNPGAPSVDGRCWATTFPGQAYNDDGDGAV